MAQREAAEGYLFISPWIVGFILFTIGPMLASLYFSFTDYNIVSSPRWAGLANYAEILFDDALFWQSIKVTLYYAALSLPSGLIVGRSCSIRRSLVSTYGAPCTSSPP